MDCNASRVEVILRKICKTRLSDSWSLLLPPHLLLCVPPHSFSSLCLILDGVSTQPHCCANNSHTAIIKPCPPARCWAKHLRYVTSLAAPSSPPGGWVYLCNEPGHTWGLIAPLCPLSALQMTKYWYSWFFHA